MINFLSSSPFLGGAEYQLRDLILGLAKTHDIRLICSKTSPLKDKLLGSNVKIEHLDFGSTLGKFRGLNILDPKNVVRMRKLRDQLNASKFTEHDLIITYDYKELILVRKAKGSTKHIHIQHPQFPGWLKLNPILKTLVVSSLNKTEKVVVDCWAVKKHLQQFGVHEDKIEVIYNGIDENLFLPPAAEEKNKARTKLGLNGKIIGINARLNAGKGYETLIEAFDILRQKVPDAYLVSVGGGNHIMEKKIKSKVTKLGLESRVKFLGSWDHEDIPSFYHALDVFTLPSETEGLPLSVIEAMFSSLPVVATMVGGIPEEVVNNETGLLIKPRDSGQLVSTIVKLLKNKPRSQKMGREGRKIALQKFTKKHMVKVYVNLFTKLVAKA